MNILIKSPLKFLSFLIKHPLLCLHYVLKAPYWGQARLFANSLKSPDKSNIHEHSHAPSNPFKEFVCSRIQGKGIIKTNHYLDIYQQYLGRFIGKNVSILEIGVFSGGSLEMWQTLFGAESKIYGVDIETACKNYESKNVRIFIGDQESRAFWKQTVPSLTALDIVIDDGGHKAEQQIVTFEETFNLLKPGGIYICEDIPGENNRFLSYMHALTLPLYQNTMIETPSEQNHQGQTLKAGNIQKLIKAIHFLPFAVIVEKNETVVGDFITDPKGDRWLSFELLRK